MRLVFVLLLAGCLPVGNDLGRTCRSGTTCSCDVIGNCEVDCPNGNCHFQCSGTSNCTFTCPGGGCDLLCQNTGNCILMCSGASNCDITCRNTGNCILQGAADLSASRPVDLSTRDYSSAD
jgi:hypothetical protein